MPQDFGQTIDYVTAVAGGQLFGLPIVRVQEVFALERMTRVPLAAPDVAGILNLRGRIVTVIDIRVSLGLGGAPRAQTGMVVGVESCGESYGLLVDEIGDVLRLDPSQREGIAFTFDKRIASVADGVFRLDDSLLLTLDIDRVLGLADAAAA